MKRASTDHTGNGFLKDVVGSKADAPVSSPTDQASLVAYMKGMLTTDSDAVNREWYVNSDVTASGAGRSWEGAFKTVGEAITAADEAHDTIYIKKGIYDEGAVHAITVEGLRIIGASGSGDMWGTSGLKASAADHIIFTINANEVEIRDLAFIQNNANAVIEVATTVSTYKTLIKGCYFGGGSAQTYGVRGGYTAGTYDSVDVVVEDCTFYQCVVGVKLNGTRCTIRNNVFLLSAGDTAIDVPMSGANRPEQRILDNIIRGANSSDKGIYFSATPTEALFTMVGNRVVNVATPVTVAQYTSWYDGNYWGTKDAWYHSSVSEKGGRVLYVDKDLGTTGLDGLSWASGFLTITEGIAALADNDMLVIAPGFYTEAAALTITESNIKVMGLNTHGSTRGPCSFKTPTAAGAMLTIAIDANDVEICNISFIATSGQKAIQLGGAAAGYVWRTHIHDCAFYGDSTGTYAVAVYGATTTPAAGAFPDCAEAVVENCYFYQWVTAAICTYGTRMVNRDNTIFVIAAGVGIVLGVGRPMSEVSGNKIIGKASTDTGILITGDSDGDTLVYNNCVTNCNVNITPTVSDAGLVNNPTYIDGAVLAQVDPT